jgi:HEPN domain-containing protein
MERSKDWIFQARGDLAHAQLDVKHGFFDWACFSAQQAAEKAVKAVHSYLGGEAWGHAVTDLVEALPDAVVVPQSISDAARELDKVYISARYPDALPSGAPRSRFTRSEAERMVGHGQSIVEFCESHLPPLQS